MTENERKQIIQEIIENLRALGMVCEPDDPNKSSPEDLEQWLRNIGILKD